MWVNTVLKSLSNPSVRMRRLATSGFFVATFAASILTVSLSASTILPCPANVRSKSRGALADYDQQPTHTADAPSNTHIDHSLFPFNGVGQRILLTKKGGWIEIQQPPPRHPPPTPSTQQT